MNAQAQGADSGRWSAIPRALIFLRCGDELLLMKRSPRSRVFPGRYNGLGGHIERDEDPLSGARRELCEETGLSPGQIRNWRLRGISHVDSGQSNGIMVFIFTAETDSRAIPALSDAASDASDSAEGRLEWFPLARLLHIGEVGKPDLPLVDDLPLLLPRLFGPNADDAPFFAHVRYDAADRMIMTFAG